MMSEEVFFLDGSEQVLFIFRLIVVFLLINRLRFFMMFSCRYKIMSILGILVFKRRITSVIDFVIVGSDSSSLVGFNCGVEG